MGIKCFLIERTGNKREVPCNCGNAECKSVDIEHEWKRADTGETQWSEWWPHHIFGPGAMWWQEFIDKHEDGSEYKGRGDWNNDDGVHLMVVCPDNHSWDIDHRASNCDQPNDRMHRCWVRHGVPPNVSVDKNGLTCGAGRGSIWAGNWHGFLTNGELVQV